MKILVTNHWLKKLGGSETFTYTLVKAAKEYGAQVHLFTFHGGLMENRIRKDFGITNTSLSDSYDLILANHNTTVDHCYSKNLGPIIQTCHGPANRLEQPSPNADILVAVSREIQDHILNKYKRPSYVIMNSIDTDRFTDRTVLSPKIFSVLSLTHSENLNFRLKQIFNRRAIEFKSHNKFKNPIWDIEKEIWQNELIISLGRGACEALSCGRPVLVLDSRPYQPLMADGLITPENIDEFSSCNFSGRYNKIPPVNLEDFISQQLRLYNDDYQIDYRHWALQNLDYKLNFKKYLDLWEQIK